jgi:hypothetical protein
VDIWPLDFYQRGSIIYGWTTGPVELHGEVGYHVVVYNAEIGPQPGVTWCRRVCCQADAKVAAIHMFELGLDPTVDFLVNFELAED